MNCIKDKKTEERTVLKLEYETHKDSNERGKAARCKYWREEVVRYHSYHCGDYFFPPL